VRWFTAFIRLGEARRTLLVSISEIMGGSFKMKLLTAVLVYVLAQLVILGAPLPAQTDPAKLLVGQWEGQVETPRNQERVLTINSVAPKNGGWVAEGRFGIPPAKGEPVTINISSQDGKLVLEFEATAQVNNPWRLTLVNETQLEGTGNFVVGRKTVDRRATFQKVEQK
jgi:hypothetical protein